MLRLGMDVVRTIEDQMVKDIQAADTTLVQNCLEMFARNLRG